jgi:hypothetical protein
MKSTVCAACGYDVPDPEARFCSSCGASVVEIEPAPDDDAVGETQGAVTADVADVPVPATDVPANGDSGTDAAGMSGSLSRFSLEVTPRHRLTEEQWQYVTWGAVAAGAVAIVALLAVVFGLLSSRDETSRSPVAAAGESTTTTTTVARRIGIVTEFPVIAPAVVESPQIGESVGYLEDWAFIAVRLTVDTCERSDGMLKAGGSIRNDSRIGQTLDYHIAVDMTRRVVGASLASLEATVEDLGPRETAEWGVEAVSTRTVNVACDIAALTVAPSEIR